jgi:tetratricopeptide (TPR) repeat protein
MVFGRLRPRRAEGGRGPKAARHLVARPAFAWLALASLLAVAALAACGAGVEQRLAAAFASSLSSLDEALLSPQAKALDSAFSRAFRSARSPSDWLCLLKRAKASEAKGDAGRYEAAADRALKAFPRSDPVAAAAAQAYLRHGHPRKALSLFGRALSIEARPKLWAEAFLASMREPGFEATSSEYGRLADIAGDPGPFLGAAAAALATGDRLAAAAWLERARSGGAWAPPELLWDCGLYEELANRSDSSAGSAELALMGDAAWKSGEVELAKRRWARAIALGPSLSWKPYANLALLSGSRGELAASYWARLRSAFLASPPSPEREGALGSYAAYLAREGQDAEALSALKGGSAPGSSDSTRSGASGRLAALELAIRGRSMPEGRYAVELERLASQRPDDSEVMGAALRALAQRGMYGEAALLEQGAARRKLPLEYGWFYGSASLAARGDYRGAVSAIRAGGPGSEGAEGRFALASLLSATGDPVGAAAEYSRAAATARGSRDKCAALKALGRELGAAGDSAGAARAYRGALAADPSDAEAAILARAILAKDAPKK